MERRPIGKTIFVEKNKQNYFIDLVFDTWTITLHYHGESVKVINHRLPSVCISTVKIKSSMPELSGWLYEMQHFLFSGIEKITSQKGL